MSFLPVVLIKDSDEVTMLWHNTFVNPEMRDVLYVYIEENYACHASFLKYRKMYAEFNPIAKLSEICSVLTEKLNKLSLQVLRDDTKY